MDSQFFDGSPRMTPDDFIRIAADRGKKLWIDPKKWDVKSMTDGERSYSLPRHLPGGLMREDLIEELLYHFFAKEAADLLRPDFHLRPIDD